MPNNIVKSFASKTGKSVGEVEKLWKKAKKIAIDENRKEDLPYITGILKNMLGIKENIKLKRYKSLFSETMTSGDIAITPENAGGRNGIEKVKKELEDINKNNKIPSI